MKDGKNLRVIVILRGDDSESYIIYMNGSHEKISRCILNESIIKTET